MEKTADATGTSSRGAKNRISTTATSCTSPLLRGEHILVGVALALSRFILLNRPSPGKPRVASKTWA
eukprot:scaffold16329_cov121-Isochrysis_galbana.AAC.2